ncbi:YMGG-like glycine zipper-containing protein [Paraburkholderia fungorum]|uniref:YMGG-like glycine zipper-containing protein n=1 Tax=Paraburkholderia fungorum TaxID=134537 RepID=UPI001C1F077F|nr:YMGG-like glycine zipper-containing protein [Paraburkholderia fungorum]MBU7435868.1 glycine zipper family protein [Paraburkholderia fungorum]
MLPIVRMLTAVFILTLACSAIGQQPIIYPAKGQSASRQQSDTAECQLWAKQTTGVDPVAIAQQSGQAGAAPKQGGAVKGAAGGAALGAAVGAVAGNAGKGAAIGAVTGTAAGGMRQRRANQAEAAQQQAGQQQTSQQMATFNRAVAACMTGRGYTVQ